MEVSREKKVHRAWNEPRRTVHACENIRAGSEWERWGRRGGLSISTMEKPGFNGVRLKKMDRNIGECITRIGDWLHCNFYLLEKIYMLL